MLDLIKKVLYRVRGEVDTKTLVKHGMIVGKNFKRMSGSWLDPGHCWLITIGNNVTLAPRVMLIAHDAAPQSSFSITRVGNINIGDNVFMGANSIVLPGVTIGNDVIVGSGSVVTHDIPDRSVVAGNPAKIIRSLDEYEELIAKKRENGILLGQEYLEQNIDDQRKLEMKLFCEEKDVFIERYKG